MKALQLLLCLLFWIPAFAQVGVKGYYRKNGTYVKPHQRTRPNNTVTDNYSYKGNVNPHTGEVGTKTYNSTQRVQYVEDNTVRKFYEGTRTPKLKGGKEHYSPIETTYPAKINSLARFYVTYDVQNRGERYEPFLDPGTMVEVLGRDKDGLYLVKYEDREGFIKEQEIDYVEIRKPEPEKIIEFDPFASINRFKYALGVTVGTLAVFRETPETREDNIISKPPRGSIIKVMAYESDDFWVVEYNNRLGYMMDAYYRLLSDKEVERYYAKLQSAKDTPNEEQHKKGLLGRLKRRDSIK